MKYMYSIANLGVQSELLLPTLAVSTANSPIDSLGHVSIIYGLVCQNGLNNPTHQGFNYQTTSTEFWLNIPSIARFQVSKGEQIIIDPVDGIDDESIRTFLLSICIEVLLRQRYHLVASGFALKFRNYGVGFVSNLSSGLAILQGLFYKQGFSFLGSNFFALNSIGEVVPGVGQLEFWPSSATTLGLDTKTLKILRPGIEKYVLPLEEQYYSKPLPLKTIYTIKMNKQSEITFSPMDEADKIPYLQEIAKTNSIFADLWDDINPRLLQSDIANNIQMVTIYLPIVGLKLRQVIDLIENDLVEREQHYA